MRLARQHASDVISVQLKRRSASPRDVLNSLHSAGVLPDVESSSLRLSRSLLPVIHQLKWSFQRDALSRTVKGFRGFTGSIIDFGVWFERTGNRFMEENERVRLAVCPDISKIIAFYEGLGRSVWCPNLYTAYSNYWMLFWFGAAQPPHWTWIQNIVPCIFPADIAKQTDIIKS